jgi:hypothetical protein
MDWRRRLISVAPPERKTIISRFTDCTSVLFNRRLVDHATYRFQATHPEEGSKDLSPPFIRERISGNNVGHHFGLDFLEPLSIGSACGGAYEHRA